MKNLKTTIFATSIVILLGLSFTTFTYKAFLPAIALIIGILQASFLHDSKLSHHAKPWSTKILSIAIILLGFGFNLTNIVKAGISGIGYTVVSILGTLILGLIIGKLLSNNKTVSLLISSGTAICGGSAIAAISPVIDAKPEETAIAMGAIFLLNALALVTFPHLGHMLHLSEHQFGLLAALAIHDTSSVVGSCMSYGSQALLVGTTVKLVRALWIIPVTLIIATSYHRKSTTSKKVKKPWFILWFIVASLIVTIFPSLVPIGTKLKHIGESLFIVALFIIGYNVSFKNIKAVGGKVLLQAVVLWCIVSVCVITALKTGFLH